MNIKVTIFATPQFTLPIIKALEKSLRSKQNPTPIVAVVTQKPKPVGRKQILTYSPVDTWAYKKGIPVYYDPQDLIKKSVKSDLGILVAYGKILPSQIINHFPHGIINIHFSLLPRFRGASPVQASILLGDKQTGISFIKIDENLDRGHLISQIPHTINPKDTSETLLNSLSVLSAQTLPGIIEPFIKGKINLVPLGTDPQTFTTTIKKDHAFISPNILNSLLSKKPTKTKIPVGFIKDFKTIPSEKFVERLIRAMTPWPNTWTMVKLDPNSKDTKRLIIYSSHLDNGLVIDEVQVEGKTKVSWEEFTKGYPRYQFPKNSQSITKT